MSNICSTSGRNAGLAAANTRGQIHTPNISCQAGMVTSLLQLRSMPQLGSALQDSHRWIGVRSADTKQQQQQVLTEQVRPLMSYMCRGGGLPSSPSKPPLAQQGGDKARGQHVIHTVLPWCCAGNPTVQRIHLCTVLRACRRRRHAARPRRAQAAGHHEPNLWHLPCSGCLGSSAGVWRLPRATDSKCAAHTCHVGCGAVQPSLHPPTHPNVTGVMHAGCVRWSMHARRAR